MANNRFFQNFIFPNVPGKWDQEERRYSAGIRDLFDSLFARIGRIDKANAATAAAMDYLFMMEEIDLPTDAGDKVQKVAGYYRKGSWDIRMVWDAVSKWITAAEYEEITGVPHPATRPD